MSGAVGLKDVAVAEKPQKPEAKVESRRIAKRMSVSKRVATTRRVAVRAETHGEGDEANLEDEAHQKSDEEKATLRSALSSNEIFGGQLSEEQYEFLIKGFARQSVEVGKVVVKQGDMGDHFYIVGAGEFEATLEQKGGAVVASYKAGDSFGELALLYNSPRAATVACTKGEALLWAIDRKRFRSVLVHGRRSSRPRRETSSTGSSAPT